MWSDSVYKIAIRKFYIIYTVSRSFVFKNSCICPKSSTWIMVSTWTFVKAEITEYKMSFYRYHNVTSVKCPFVNIDSLANNCEINATKKSATKQTEELSSARLKAVFFSSAENNSTMLIFEKRCHSVFSLLLFLSVLETAEILRR